MCVAKVHHYEVLMVIAYQSLKQVTVSHLATYLRVNQ
jgi:hypothetical protein